MSNTFIGLTMLVTLTSPPGAQLRGIVSGIEPGSSLTLRNVTCPSTGRYVPEFTINAAEIQELVEAVSENAVRATAPPPRAISVLPDKTFEDPAILSVGKRPTPGERPLPAMISSASIDLVHSSRSVASRELRDITPAATLINPMKKLAVSEESQNKGGYLQELPDTRHALPEKADAETKSEQRERKQDGLPEDKREKRRNRGRKPRRDDADVEPDPVDKKTKQPARSRGWRQTPLLEPNPSFQPYTILNKRGTRREENGWATEDATDVQDMGDFDFEGGLARFDKSTVFSKLQAEDSVAEEDRLVSHNRLPRVKPGTAGGKNLHYTENVLEKPRSANATPKMKAEAWAGTSEAEESDYEERNSQRGSGSSRHIRRTDSKLSISRRPTDMKCISRKGSAIISMPTTRALSLSRASGGPAFLIIPSDRRCESISPLQMLNLETIADNELGLSEDMMAENAGRGLAEIALSALNTGGLGLTHGNSAVATVLVLAGNNKSGLRAVAAARHIRNHGPNVVVCVLGLEREAELLVGLKRQINVFRNFGGKILNRVELFDYAKQLDEPAELIIDGILGLTISFDELRLGDQATAHELIAWANRNKASVLAVDIPTGIDPTTGKISIINGRQIYLNANYIVAIGAPKKGLMEAMTLGEGVINRNNLEKGKEWQLFVVDIGLSAAVWKKAGTKVRRGVEFEGSWVLPMRFQPGTE